MGDPRTVSVRNRALFLLLLVCFVLCLLLARRGAKDGEVLVPRIEEQPEQAAVVHTGKERTDADKPSAFRIAPEREPGDGRRFVRAVHELEPGLALRDLVADPDQAVQANAELDRAHVEVVPHRVHGVRPAVRLDVNLVAKILEMLRDNLVNRFAHLTSPARHEPYA